MKKYSAELRALSAEIKKGIARAVELGLLVRDNYQCPGNNRYYRTVGRARISLQHNGGEIVVNVIGGGQYVTLSGRSSQTLELWDDGGSILCPEGVEYGLPRLHAVRGYYAPRSDAKRLEGLERLLLTPDGELRDMDDEVSSVTEIKTITV